MLESVDRSVSKTDALWREGSIPSLGITKVYGPYEYTNKRGVTRRWVTVAKEDGGKIMLQHARLVMMIYLDRWLEYDETVHHVDGDPLNDALENLSVVDRAEHAQMHQAHREIEWQTFTCLQCSRPGRQRAKDYRHNRRQGKAGPFCSKRCAGKWSTGETEWHHFDCPECGRPSKKKASHVRNNKSQGKAGPFCSRRCAGRWSQRK